MGEPARGWRRCSACKKPIDFEQTYWTCSVSTCNRKRTALYFCTVSCWEVHLPVARHREAWAEEQRAPSQAEEAARASASTGAPRQSRRPVREASAQPVVGPAVGGHEAPREVLIIASRLKEYIRSSSGLNTSERVLEPLSEIVREICDRAARRATQDGRKTVLERDIQRTSPTRR